MRRQRIKSLFSVVAIKRVIAVAAKAGLSVNSLEVRADGTIGLGTA